MAHTSKRLATGNINHEKGKSKNKKKDKKKSNKGSEKCIPKLMT